MSSLSFKRPVTVGCAGIIALLAGAMLAPVRARACTKVPPPDMTFKVDPALQASDREAPAPPTEVSASVYRTTDTVCTRDGVCTSNHCGSGGFVVLHYAEPQPSEELGVRVVVLEGTLPDAMAQRIGTLQRLTASMAFDVGFDGASRIDAVVALTLVDRAGNESQQSAPIRLAWSGCTASAVGHGCLDEERYRCSEDGCSEVSGCSVAPGYGLRDPSLGAWPLALACAVWLAARRRRCR